MSPGDEPVLRGKAALSPIMKLDLRDFAKAAATHKENHVKLKTLSIRLLTSDDVWRPLRRSACDALGDMRAPEGAPALAARVNVNLALRSYEITVENSYRCVGALIKIGVPGALASMDQMEIDTRSKPPKEANARDWNYRIQLRRKLLALVVLRVYGEKLAKVVLEDKIAEAKDPKVKAAFQEALEEFPRIKNWLPKEKKPATRPATATAPVSRPVMEASNRGHLLFGLEDNRLRIVRACEERLRRIPKTRSILTEDEVVVIWALRSYRSDALPTLEALLRVVHMRRKKSKFPKSKLATFASRPDRPELLSEYPAARALINIGLPGVRAITWELDASEVPLSEERLKIFAGIVLEVLKERHARPFIETERKVIRKVSPAKKQNYDAVLRFIDKICAERRARELERQAEIRKMFLILKASTQQAPKFAKAPATKPVTRPATKPPTTTMPGTLPQDN